MPDPKTLPFDLNEPAVAEWLNEISDESPVNAASQLNQVLTAFRKTKVPDNVILPLLLKLAPVSLHSSHTLSKLLKSGVPDHKTLKIAKLSLLLLRNQSLALLQIANATATEKSDKLYAVFYAIQFIGQYLRLSSQYQELPSETLWQVSGELYITAKQHELLHLPVSSKISEFRQQHCIIDAIKRNILFTLIGFHRLSASDNQTIYGFSNDYGNLIALKHVTDSHDLFSWSIGQNIPYFSQENQHKTGPSQKLSIDTTRLQSILRPASFKAPISNDLIDYLLKVCTGYNKQMNDGVPSPPVIFGLCIGIKACHTYLSQQQRLNRIQHLSAQVKEQAKEEEDFINMSLMPLDHEKKLQDNALTQPSSPIPSPSLQSLINAKITQTNQSDYILAQTQQQGCNSGELILLINNKNAITPGIVRQVKTNADNSSAKLLIEKFKAELTPHNFYSEQNDMSGQLISVNENSDKPELFLPYAKYRNGSRIQFNNRTARLVSLVDYSLSFTRYRITFD
jgi:hypothetical protein